MGKRKNTSETKKWLLITGTVFLCASLILALGALFMKGWQQPTTAERAANRSTGEKNADHAASSEGLDKPTPGGSVAIPLYEAIPQELHPLEPTNSAAKTVTNLLFEPLVRVQPDGQAEGVLASEWDISPDRRTLTVRVQRGVKWHDGQPLTAQDVVFTYNQLASPTYKGPYRHAVKNIVGFQAFNSGKAKQLKGIERSSKGGGAIVFHLQRPLAQSLDLLQVPVIPEHVYSQLQANARNKVKDRAKHARNDQVVRNDQAKSNEQRMLTLIGSGPYQLTAQSERNGIEMERFLHYRQTDITYLERITFRPLSVTEAATEFAQGNVDVLPYLDAALIEADKQVAHSVAGETKDIVQVTSPGELFHYVAFNPEQKLWRDRALRQAVGQVIDKEKLVQQWLNGYGEPIDTPRGTTVAAAKGEGEQQQARDLLRHKLKKKTIRLHYASEWVERERLADQLQQQWEAAGLSVKLVKHKRVAELAEALQEGEADLFLMSDWIRADADPLVKWWTDGEWRHWTRWPTPNLQKTLKKCLIAPAAKRERLLAEWEAQFVREAPLIPLVQPQSIALVNSKLRDVGGGDFKTDYLRLYNWWVKKSSS